jgi:RimJ/RimL family protein N-acetyltransferase
MGGSENPDSPVVVDRRADGTEPVGERSPVVLSDDSVVLRPWTLSDAIFMVEASRDPAIERYNGPVPASVAAAITVIERIEQSWRTFEVEGDPTGAAFAIVDAAAGAPVGMCGIDHWSSTDVAQFGYWLAAGARGRGLATRAITLMTGWLFELGAARVVLTIHSENAASAAVALRAGFTYEGTHRAHGVWAGQRKDVDVFAALPDEWPPARDAPEARSTDCWGHESLCERACTEG